MGVYLDHAATSFPKPEPVLVAIEYFYRKIGANSGRGAYRLALQADEMVYKTRKVLGQFFNIEDVSRIIFTSNVTEAPGIDLKPLKEGGTGGDSLLEHQPFHLPDRYEAGTLNLSGIAGLYAAVSFLEEKGVEKVRAHELELTAFALEQLQKVPGLTLYGPQKAEERAAVFSFNLENIPPEEVSYVLDEVYGIMVRSGLHCAPQSHRCLGTVDRGAVRVGLGYSNRKEDLEKLRTALEEIVQGAHEEGGRSLLAFKDI